MSIPDFPNLTAKVPRQPEAASESRLAQLREEARLRGLVQGEGIRPAGSPFPQASPESGYYGIHLLKQPQWSWEVPVYFFVGGAAGSQIGAYAYHLAGWTGLTVFGALLPIVALVYWTTEARVQPVQ